MSAAISRPNLAHVGVARLVEDALAEHGARLAIACSLGIEDVVLLHEASAAAERLGVAPRVFTIDTGRLPAETYAFLDVLQSRYRLPIAVLFPARDGVEALVARDGINGFYGSVDARRACCAVRKLEPLGRALEGASAWMTGLRREQSPTRADVQPAERDERGLLKYSPLFDWSEADVWAYAEERKLPVHPLHRAGYPSIGCAPCTRAIAPGELVRAGRWWWESAEHKECGLHPRGAR